MLKKTLVLTLVFVLALAATVYAEDLYVIDINGGTWAGGDNNLEVTSDKLPIDNDVTYNGQPSLRINVYQEGTWWCGFIAFPARDLTQYKDAYLQFAIKGEKGGETFGVGFKSGVYDADPEKNTESNPLKEIVATADWTVVSIPIKDYIEMDITPAFVPTEVTEFQVRSLNNSALKAWIADVKIVSEPAADAKPAASNPQTGDYGVASLIALAAASAIGVVVSRKRK